MKELPKHYNPQEAEGNVYNFWEKNGFFKPKIKENVTPFTIIMPPPNANESLHIGHARFVFIEDVLIRYWRMKGRPTLWLPGADHAGIETQYVFEKKLAKEGKSRFDFNRKKLYQMIWDYVAENRKIMEQQLRMLGASCDWSRFVFTLDPKVIEIVYETFYRLYHDNLIYRGERVVNYCTKCGTAFSQLEVNYIEKKDNLYFINYDTVTIATTRPETIFADVAIAVNPKDRKNKHLIGQTATVPIINRKVPIIADEAVDPKFGTGALKVTPAHDPTDFEIAQRHDLDKITVIGKDGKLKNVPPPFIGLKAEKARDIIVETLKKNKKLLKTKEIVHNVGTCYRDSSTIEPLLEEQWFLKIEPLTKATIKAIREGRIKFAAKKYEKIALHWLENLRDWNISRQIVWGIQIPAWRCQKCNRWIITKGDSPQKCDYCNSKNLIRDTDTFDTWFSSGQWPFAALKANSEKDFRRFYPTTVMETGYDILPFWVIRMAMLGLYVTRKVPFTNILLHGLVRDKHGQKISKSKGNVIDPIEMVEKYGSDALRMGLLWGALVENDVSISEEKIRGQKFFANKIWNASRFVMLNLIDYQDVSRETIKKELTNEDRQIIKKLTELTEKVSEKIEKYRLNEAAELIYKFFWNEFCDRYLEIAKIRIKENQQSKKAAQYTLKLVLSQSLIIMHPFLPFITEYIWKHLGYSEPLITAKWPN